MEKLSKQEALGVLGTVVDLDANVVDLNQDDVIREKYPDGVLPVGTYVAKIFGLNEDAEGKHSYQQVEGKVIENYPDHPYRVKFE